MRIVVSGTHASGKSTLVSDVAAALGYPTLPDPFELVDEWEDPAGAASFVTQLAVAAERLVELAPASNVVAERGPLDLLAYLGALPELGRGGVGVTELAHLREVTARAMAHVDLLVLVPLEPQARIHVPDDEEPELREAMAEQLLDLCDDDELVGGVGRLVEVSGSPEARLALVLAAVDGDGTAG